MEVQGRRRKWMTKGISWLDSVRDDLKENWLSREREEREENNFLFKVEQNW